MNDLSLAALYRYPIKSARGESLHEAVTDRFGVHGDRRWMLIDDRGCFVSQRSIPVLALLEVTTHEQTLILGFRGSKITLPRLADDSSRARVTVWADELEARLAPDEVNSWLSRQFGQPLRLAYYPEDAQRPVDPVYAPQGQYVSFADGFPVLLISQASLDWLNERLPEPVPMDRFRPNIVVDGAKPHAEDSWRRLRIGDAEVSLVKPCSRCAIPSIDQSTAERDPHISRALASYRRSEGEIYFGMNGLAQAGSVFRVGDKVQVID